MLNVFRTNAAAKQASLRTSMGMAGMLDTLSGKQSERALDLYKKKSGVDFDRSMRTTIAHGLLGKGSGSTKHPLSEDIKELQKAYRKAFIAGDTEQQERIARALNGISGAGGPALMPSAATIPTEMDLTIGLGGDVEMQIPPYLITQVRELQKTWSDQAIYGLLVKHYGLRPRPEHSQKQIDNFYERRPGGSKEMTIDRITKDLFKNVKSKDPSEYPDFMTDPTASPIRSYWR